MLYIYYRETDRCMNNISQVPESRLTAARVRCVMRVSRLKNGVHPACGRVPWPADLRSTAASSTDAVLEIV